MARTKKKSDGCTLKQLIGKLDPECKIRICTQKPHFIYIGTVGQLSFNRLNNEIIAWHKERIESMRESCRTEKDEEQIKRAEKDLKELVHVRDRKITDTFRGLLEQCSISIKIEGKESGWLQYNPEVPLPDPKDIHENQMFDLLGSVYKAASSDLTTAYLQMRHGATKEIRNNGKLSAQALERQIRADPYGVLGDSAEVVIKKCKQQAMK